MDRMIFSPLISPILCVLLLCTFSSFSFAVDEESPGLISIEVNKTSVDVSGGAQTLIFTLETSDDSGINWSAGKTKTAVVMQDLGGGYHYAVGTSESPGILTVILTSGDKTGSWEFSFLVLTDNQDNRSMFGNAALRSFGLPASIETFGGIEALPPQLNSISINKATIDVSENDQTVDFLLDTDDPSGIDWDGGSVKTSVVMRDSHGAYHYATGVNSAPGHLSLDISSVDVKGKWSIEWLYISDELGNKAVHHYRPSLQAFGLPSFVYVLETNEQTTDLTLSSQPQSTSITENTSFSYALDAENLRSSVSGELTFEILSENLTVESISMDSGSGSCSITTIAFNSTASCVLSSIAGYTSKRLIIRFRAGVIGPADFYTNLASEIPDISFLNNYVSKHLTVILDSDGDSIGDDFDPFPYSDLFTDDSDGDGMPDTWEAQYGLDPLDPFDAASDFDNDGYTAIEEFLADTIPTGSLDLDGNTKYDALSDGMLLVRSMFGLEGDVLINGSIASDAAYISSTDILNRIELLGDLRDIDGNGDIEALTDGLLVVRHLFGLEGEALIAGVIAENATRVTAAEIEIYLEILAPEIQ